MATTINRPIKELLHISRRIARKTSPFTAQACAITIDMTLLDLFQALDEPPLLNRCQKEGYCCENHPEGGCGICRELNRVQSALNLEFQRTPLSDIFA